MTKWYNKVVVPRNKVQSFIYVNTIQLLQNTVLNQIKISQWEQIPFKKYQPFCLKF